MYKIIKTVYFRSAYYKHEVKQFSPQGIFGSSGHFLDK